MKTNFINKKNYFSELKSIITELQTIFDNSETVLSDNQLVYDKSTYHYISKLLQTKTDNRLKNTIYSILKRDLYKIETLSAQSSLVYFEFLLNYIVTILDNLNEDENNVVYSTQELDNTLLKLKKVVELNTKQMSVTDFYHLMLSDVNLSFFDNKPTKIEDAITLQALKLAGLEGKILIENSKQEKYSVELTNGFSFKTNTIKQFLDNKNSSWNKKDCKVLVIDGMIESVSEIDQILIQSNKLKQPLAIIALGYTEEVIATLYTNKQKGLLDVTPIKMLTDINSINVINDISVVCGMEPISHLKGQLLSFVKYEELPTIESVIVYENSITIQNSKTVNSVQAQIKMLLDKRIDNSYSEDIQVLLENRIKSLSPNTVTIYIPNKTIMENESIRVILDNKLRITKTLLNYGYVMYPDIRSSINENNITGLKTHSFFTNKVALASNEFENTFFMCLNRTFNTNFNFISALSFYLGIMVAAKTSILLLNSSGFVGIDDTEIDRLAAAS